MACESHVSPRSTTLRPFTGGMTRLFTGTCSPLGSSTVACGPFMIALCTASCRILESISLNHNIHARPRRIDSREVMMKRHSLHIDDDDTSVREDVACECL